MDLDEFRGRQETAEKLAARGETRAALEVLLDLAEEPALPDLDRALAWTLVAEAREGLGDRAGALAAFDRAHALESAHKRFAAAFKKADFLLRVGLREESRALFATLLERADATLAERRSIEARLKLLRRPPARK